MGSFPCSQVGLTIPRSSTTGICLVCEKPPKTDLTASLGNPFQCLNTIVVVEFFLKSNENHHCYKLPFVPSSAEMKNN